MVIAFIWPTIITGKADKIWRWRSNLSFFPMHKTGQMCLSQDMTAREIRHTSAYLRASYKITASQNYGWEKPHKIIQPICLPTTRSTTPKPFQTNICPLFSPKPSEGKLSPLLCSLYWYKNFLNDYIKYFLLQGTCVEAGPFLLKCDADCNSRLWWLKCFLWISSENFVLTRQEYLAVIQLSREESGCHLVKELVAFSCAPLLVLSPNCHAIISASLRPASEIPSEA